MDRLRRNLMKTLAFANYQGFSPSKSYLLHLIPFDQMKEREYALETLRLEGHVKQWLVKAQGRQERIKYTFPEGCPLVNSPADIRDTVRLCTQLLRTVSVQQLAKALYQDKELIDLILDEQEDGEVGERLGDGQFPPYRSLEPALELSVPQIPDFAGVSRKPRLKVVDSAS